MRNQLLRDADWAGMAHSVEILVPLVDIELLRSAGRLIANGAPPAKGNVSATPQLSLPSAVLSRAKTGFGIPVREWLLKRITHSVTSQRNGERGLRNWAKVVHAELSRN